MIPKNLLSSGTALFYSVVDAGLLPRNALTSADGFHVGRRGQAVRFTQRASYFMDGRVCGFKMRSGMVLYWSPHVVTIRLFFAVWPTRMQGNSKWRERACNRFRS